MNRYARQIPIIGEDGQKRLEEAKVLVVGAGGLGSPVIAYLAGAGVGRIGIVDGDVVEEHNLQRQIIHAGKVGMNKAESAKEFVESLNPEIEAIAYPFHVNSENVKDLVKEYDVIVSCPDSFEIRLILNDVCVKLRKPMVHGAIYGFEGEIMTITGSPCYRCLYMSFPKVDSSAIAVMGFTAGFFGCIQASETIKLILGMDVLKGKLFRGDLRSMEFFTIDVKPNPKCPTCASHQ